MIIHSPFSNVRSLESLQWIVDQKSLFHVLRSSSAGTLFVLCTKDNLLTIQILYLWHKWVFLRWCSQFWRVMRGGTLWSKCLHICGNDSAWTYWITTSSPLEPVDKATALREFRVLHTALHSSSSYREAVSSAKTAGDGVVTGQCSAWELTAHRHDNQEFL